MFKYKLLQGNWIYVFKDMDKAKIVDFQSGDFFSVGSDTIVKRLENLCGIKLVKADAESLRSLRKARNNAEHFRFEGDILTLKELIHNCITVLIKIILEHYDCDEFTDDERDLFSKIRLSLLQSEKHYDEALKIAQKELTQSGRESEALICPQCKEEFLLVEDGWAKCSSCNYQAQGEKAARDYISNVLEINEHELITKGNSLPLFDCPDCNDWSLVLDEANGNTAICFSCGFYATYASLLYCNECEKQFVCVQYAEDEVASCPECGEDIPFEE